MAKNNYTCGIDIGTHTTRIVVTNFDTQNSNPTVIAIGQAPTSGMRRGYIVNVDQVAKSIKQALAQAQKNLNFKIKNVFVSIGGINLTSATSVGQIITTRADQEVTSFDISKAIENSQENIDTLNKKIIQTIPLAYKLDGKEVYGRPEGMKGVKLEVRVLFILCLKQNIEDIVTALALSGLEPLDIIPAPLANAASLLSVKQKTAGCALVDIGAETVSVSVYENNTIISLHVFPIGSLDITKDIALGFKIDLDDAENIKTGTLTSLDYPKKKVDEIIYARLEDIFELIGNYFKKIKRNELLPAGVILFGGGSNTTNANTVARNQLRLPARIGHIEQTIDTNKFKLYDGFWYTALGLCIYHSDGSLKNAQGDSVAEFFQKIKNFCKGILTQLLP